MSTLETHCIGCNIPTWGSARSYTQVETTSGQRAHLCDRCVAAGRTGPVTVEDEAVPPLPDHHYRVGLPAGEPPDAALHRA